MSKIYEKNLTGILGLLFLILFPWVLNGKTFSSPATGMVVSGDLLHAAAGTSFIDVIYSRNGEVFYNRLSSSGEWDVEVLLGEGTEGRMAMDNAGNPHVVFSSGGKIAYLKRTESGWSTVEYIESLNAGTCSRPDIDVTNSGVAYITYTDSKGNVGNYTDRQDIMLAENSTGSFAITLIYNGYLEYYGGADRYAEYFEHGSFIAVTDNGDYYILSLVYQYQTWMGGNYKQYSVVVKSNLGNGGTSASSSNIFGIYDLEFDGTSVLALYKESTFKVSELTASNSVVSFTNTRDVSASSVSSMCANGTNEAVGGKNSANLFTEYNELGHIYENVEVKNAVVSAVEAGSVFYAVYTDSGDGMIKIREVATPLSLTRFEFDEQAAPADINGVSGTVQLTLKSGTDLETLVASFAATSDVTDIQVGEIPQTSEVTVNDFSSPVAYRLSDGVLTRDWVVTAALEILDTVEVSICEGDMYDFGAQSLAAAGEYKEIFTMDDGRDSTVVLILTVNPVFNEDETVVICSSELPYTFGTQTLSESGFYTEVFQSVTGCDSTVNLTLTVNPVFNEDETVAICSSELPYTFGTQTLSESGFYTEVFQSVTGCDSTVNLTLTVKTVDTSVLQEGKVLTALAANATFQWVSCDNGNLPVVDETNPVFTPTQNGSFAVEVFQDGCRDISVCYTVTTVGLLENTFEQAITVSPNPTQGEITVKLGERPSETQVGLFDLEGRLIKRVTYRNQDQLKLTVPGPKGIYVIRIEAGSQKALLKVVKE